MKALAAIRREFLDSAGAISSRINAVMDELIDAGKAATGNGAEIDNHQPAASLLAELAAMAKATEANIAYAERVYAKVGGGVKCGYAVEAAAHFAATTAAQIQDAIRREQFPGWEMSDRALDFTNDIKLQGLIADLSNPKLLSEIGDLVLETRGRHPASLLLPDELQAVRDSAAQFAANEVRPLAQLIHNENRLVPESIIDQMGALGYFSLGIPANYGGAEAGALAMVVTTEELSAASLAAAGSLITRPEILARALLAPGGGTEEQRQRWLPGICLGKTMVAISVTEPDTGSDVARVACRAVFGEQDGKKGYFVTGAKAWCTFAGRANLIALLVRTDPDLSKGYKGLSLLVVEKDQYDGLRFEEKQPGGGTLIGEAIETPGYRGMHSFVLTFENFFVPAENLVGKEGAGFKLMMGGFAAGRLQTGGRAVGVAQEALEVTARYGMERKQFGKVIGEHGDFRHKLGLMAVQLQAARQLTYLAAEDFDANPDDPILAAMAKLLGARIAVFVTLTGQLLHGGWGYGSEYTISRLVSDAVVLKLFEGTEPILALAVIARRLLAA